VKKFLVIAAFGLGLGALGVGALVLFVRRDHEALPREEQLYDDFGFSVLSAERAGGQCTVELQVANHARRVPFKLAGYRLRLVDASGTQYEERAELAIRPRKEIGPGERVAERHVFELPESAQAVVLELSFGSIPDALDWLFLGKRTWTLPLR
jgi:hypothetical protein